MEALKIVRNGLFAAVPVAISLAIMLFFRADSLVAEGTGIGLILRSREEAITIGLSIWMPAASVIGIASSLIYSLASKRLNWRPVHFLVFTIIIALIISIGALAARIHVPEAFMEMFICGIGFGVMIPWLSERTDRKR